MNRRDFIKLIGLLGISLAIPKGDEMPFGDALQRIARGEKLSEGEIQSFGQTANLLEQFIEGMKAGSVDISVKSLKTIYGDFSLVPTNAAWFGWSGLFGVSFPQDLTASNTFQVISTGFTDVLLNAKSCMGWYSQATGKIATTQEFAASSPKLISFTGNVQFASPSTACQLNVYVKRKSNDAQVGVGALVKDTASSDCGGFNHSFAASINLAGLGVLPSEVYLEFQAKSTFVTGTSGVALDVMFFRTL